MTQISLVGIGTGNPDHLTLEAVKTLGAADLILLPRKGEEKRELADVRRQILDEIVTTSAKIVEFDYPIRDETTPQYLDGVNSWHDALAAIWAELISAHAETGAKIALMVWGDPSLYDSTLRIADRLKAQGMEIAVKVVPGITSLQMLTAAHAIPLNDLGAPVLITTGRQLRDGGWPKGVDTIAVMLDGKCSFQHLRDQADEFHIWWGGYVGMPQQVLMSGALNECCDDIIDLRARQRSQHGWIMDIYVLRRRAVTPAY